MLLLSCLLRATAHAGLRERCTPSFPFQNGLRYGWQGADAAYSIPLSGGHDLWIFGDTLFGARRTLSGGVPAMVHSSLGLSTCSPNGQWSITYQLRIPPGKPPESVFQPQAADRWYWPMDAFTWRHRLVVSLLCLKLPDVAKPAAFNFVTCGLDLAQMPISTRLLDARQTIVPLVPDGVGAYPSSTVVVHGRYAYFFGVRESAERPLLAIRVPLSHLQDPQPWRQFLATDGAWREGFRPAEAKTLLRPAPTEMTIRYHAQWHRWLAVYTDPDLASDRVLLRSAPSLLGPWSTPETLFFIRSLDPAASRPHVFCYAAKEHPELAARRQILVTYVCNTMNPAQLVDSLDIYSPKPVRVRLVRNLHVMWARAAH